MKPAANVNYPYITEWDRKTEEEEKIGSLHGNVLEMQIIKPHPNLLNLWIPNSGLTIPSVDPHAN